MGVITAALLTVPSIKLVILSSSPGAVGLFCVFPILSSYLPSPLYTSDCKLVFFVNDDDSRFHCGLQQLRI